MQSSNQYILITIYLCMCVITSIQSIDNQSSTINQSISARQKHRRRKHGRNHELRLQNSQNSQNQNCREAENLTDLLSDWLIQSTNEEASLLESKSDNLIDNDNQSIINNDDQSIFVYEDDHSECTNLPSTDLGSTVMQRALCPWTWRVNRDDNRHPKLISEAQCNCRRAKGNISAECTPIYRSIPVLRRLNCDQSINRYRYIRGYQSIAVGCHTVLLVENSAEDFENQINRRLLRQRKRKLAKV